MTLFNKATYNKKVNIDFLLTQEKIYYDFKCVYNASWSSMLYFLSLFP